MGAQPIGTGQNGRKAKQLPSLPLGNLNLARRPLGDASECVIRPKPVEGYLTAPSLSPLFGPTTCTAGGRNIFLCYHDAVDDFILAK